ncbi:hypothetical protein KAU19_01530 [Candidatus Parcubacteria bacterium]|nr:hypothetical protein [Candidatus Parcubacteria bacterium]
MFKKFYRIIIITAVLLVDITSTAHAANLQSADSYLGAGARRGGYDINVKNTPESIIAVIIQTALSFLGVVFLILAIYGGYLWMTARGNEEQLTRAKNTLTAAVVGLIIVIGAYAISYFVIERLGVGTLK